MIAVGWWCLLVVYGCFKWLILQLFFRDWNILEKFPAELDWRLVKLSPMNGKDKLKMLENKVNKRVGV